MKKLKLIIPLIITLFLISIVSAETQYQENANETQCVGKWGGHGGNNPDCSKIYDGNWSSYDEADPLTGTQFWVYFNYTKPDDVAGVEWQVKDKGGTANLTLPNNCLTTNPNKILLRGYYEDSLHCPVTWECYNGTGWEIQRTTTDCGGRFYEEGIYWNIIIPPEEKFTYDENDITGAVIDGGVGTIRGFWTIAGLIGLIIMILVFYKLLRTQK